MTSISTIPFLCDCDAACILFWAQTMKCPYLDRGASMNIYDYDVLVIGGGPAGLWAALYFARYDRSVALFDAGHGRSTWHQMNYNYLGFPGGISARELRERGYQQLAEYPQVAVLKHKIASLQRANGLLYASTQSDRWCGRAVILCTGVIDHYPQFEHWEE